MTRGDYSNAVWAIAMEAEEVFRTSFYTNYGEFLDDFVWAEVDNSEAVCDHPFAILSHSNHPHAYIEMSCQPELANDTHRAYHAMCADVRDCVDGEGNWS